MMQLKTEDLPIYVGKNVEQKKLTSVNQLVLQSTDYVFFLV